MTDHSLVGTWMLESCIGSSSSGEERLSYGPNPVGQLIYTSDGYMSVVMSRHNRPKFASTDLVGGTTEELKRAFEGLEAYAGPYEVNAENGTVTHHLAVCRYPNWESSSQLRHFVLSGDLLLLSTLPMVARGQDWVYTLTWRRAQRHI